MGSQLKTFFLFWLVSMGSVVYAPDPIGEFQEEGDNDSDDIGDDTLEHHPQPRDTFYQQGIQRVHSSDGDQNSSEPAQTTSFGRPTPARDIVSPLIITPTPDELSSVGLVLPVVTSPSPSSVTVRTRQGLQDLNTFVDAAGTSADLPTLQSLFAPLEVEKPHLLRQALEVLQEKMTICQQKELQLRTFVVQSKDMLLEEENGQLVLNEGVHTKYGVYVKELNTAYKNLREEMGRQLTQLVNDRVSQLFGRQSIEATTFSIPVDVYIRGKMTLHELIESLKQYGFGKDEDEDRCKQNIMEQVGIQLLEDALRSSSKKWVVGLEERLEEWKKQPRYAHDDIVTLQKFITHQTSARENSKTWKYLQRNLVFLDNERSDILSAVVYADAFSRVQNEYETWRTRNTSLLQEIDLLTRPLTKDQAAFREKVIDIQTALELLILKQEFDAVTASLRATSGKKSTTTQDALADAQALQKKQNQLLKGMALLETQSAFKPLLNSVKSSEKLFSIRFGQAKARITIARLSFPFRPYYNSVQQERETLQNWIDQLKKDELFLIHNKDFSQIKLFEKSNKTLSVLSAKNQFDRELQEQAREEQQLIDAFKIWQKLTQELAHVPVAEGTKVTQVLGRAQQVLKKLESHIADDPKNVLYDALVTRINRVRAEAGMV